MDCQTTIKKFRNTLNFIVFFDEVPIVCEEFRVAYDTRCVSCYEVTNRAYKFYEVTEVGGISCALCSKHAPWPSRGRQLHNKSEGSFLAASIRSAFAICIVSLDPMCIDDTDDCSVCQCVAFGYRAVTHDDEEYRICSECDHGAARMVLSVYSRLHADMCRKITLCRVGASVRLNNDIWSVIYRAWYETVDFHQVAVESVF